MSLSANHTGQASTPPLTADIQSWGAVALGHLRRIPHQSFDYHTRHMAAAKAMMPLQLCLL